MQFTCNKNELCNAIAHVAKAVSVKSTIPALEGICIQMMQGRIVLTGYDLEIGIRTSIPAQCNDAFTFVVNTRLFADMTRRMTGDSISFEIDTNLNAKLSSNDTTCRIQAMSADEFPALPVVESTQKTSIPQELLRSMIQQTSFAASTKEDKPILTGLLFEAGDGMFYVVAMDRYRLAMRQEPVPDLGAFRFVVPKKALNELIGMLQDDADSPCRFCTNGKHIVFSVNGFDLFARLLEGQFHNFKSSIPQGETTSVSMNTRDLCGCAELCSLFINDKNKAPMRCEFDKQCMSIFCKTGIGEVNDRVPADVQGDPVTIGISNKYLIEALRACTVDKVCLHMSGNSRVIKITPLEGESFVYLIMPIQLKY
ncbi:MAG: DNA polymerase III subunit beta [Oscillospiraceae bacterium]|nr:DNA polymerase III subunit beta [Oscillospiraceae bacterium]